MIGGEIFFSKTHLPKKQELKNTECLISSMTLDNNAILRIVISILAQLTGYEWEM